MHGKARTLTNLIDFIQLICALGAEGRRFESSLPDQFFLYLYDLIRSGCVLRQKFYTFLGKVLHFSSVGVLFPLVHGLSRQPFLTRPSTVMLHHLQGLVASDALDFLRGAAGLIKGRSSVLPQAMKLDRAKSKTRLVTPPDGVEATLRQRLAVPSTDNIETLALHYHQFIGQQSVDPLQVPCAPRPSRHQITVW